MSSQTDRQQAIEKLGELIGKIRVAMLTTVTEAGTLWSRPILTQRAKFDGDLWLVSKLDAPKTREVRLNRQVSLSFVKPDENIYVSVSGTAEIADDSGEGRTTVGPKLRGLVPRGPEESEPGADPRERRAGRILGRSCFDLATWRRLCRDGS